LRQFYFCEDFDEIKLTGYWKMMAYKNQQYYLLFTQYESEVCGEDFKKMIL
jgi:hypothetical protein